MKINKKAQIGLDTAKAVFLAFMLIAILAFATIMTLVIFSQTDAVRIETTTTFTNSTLNQTFSSENLTASLSGITSTTKPECVLTVTEAINETGDSNTVTIPAGNYTTSGCEITMNGQSTWYNNSLWNITGRYVWKSPHQATDIEKNVTAGAVTFFENTNAILAIIIVVIIILAVAIIIAVVMRFGGGSTRL